jgi:hypothetical protein
MSSIKVYLHIELEGYPDQTSKIQIPKSWLGKNVSDIVGLFLPAYVKKNPDHALEVPNVHLALSDGTKLFSNAKVSDVLEDHMDYYVKLGVHVSKESTIDPSSANQLRCRNYGCNQYYNEEDNNDEQCWHHVSPPIFHDTMKCWSCCRDKKAYDFETFQLIQGCTLGRHSTQVKQVSIAPSPNAIAESATPQPALKSIAAFNSANPDAASAASSAVQTLAVRKSTRNDDGTARCQRKGCQKSFNVAENVGECCTYHKGQPIFHDAAKFWSCCPQIKCYDFDDFLAVKGCAVGKHDDGVIELDE